jgi:hypothetical protein
MFLFSLALFAEEPDLINYGNVTNVDVRSAGMGRTSFSSARSSNSLFYNPARLSQSDRFEFQSGLNANFGSKEFWSDEDSSVNEKSIKFQTNFSHASVSSGITLNPNLKLGFGLGYHEYLHLKQKTVIDGNSEVIKGGFQGISGGFGIDINNRYSFGMAYYKSVNSKVDYSHHGDFGPIINFDYKNDYLMASAEYKVIPSLTLGVRYRSDYMAEYTFHDDSYKFKSNHPYEWALSASYLKNNFEWNSEIIRPFFEKHSKRDAFYYFHTGLSYTYKTNNELRAGLFRDDAFYYNVANENIPKPWYGLTLGYGRIITENLTIDTAFEYARIDHSVTKENYQVVDVSDQKFNLQTGLKISF